MRERGENRVRSVVCPSLPAFRTTRHRESFEFQSVDVGKFLAACDDYTIYTPYNIK